MDQEALEKEIEADIAAGRQPCAVLATFGAAANQPYQCDNLGALRQICDKHRLWLHAEGSSLVLAASPLSSTLVGTVFDFPHSISVEPFQWFSFPHIPHLSPSAMSSPLASSLHVLPAMPSQPHSLSMGMTFVRSSKTHTFHLRHLLPPALPVSPADFHAQFLLWFYFLADHFPDSNVDEATRKMLCSPIARPSDKPDTKKPVHTFMGSPLSGSSPVRTPISQPSSLPPVDPMAAATAVVPSPSWITLPNSNRAPGTCVPIPSLLHMHSAHCCLCLMFTFSSHSVQR